MLVSSCRSRRPLIREPLMSGKKAPAPAPEARPSFESALARLAAIVGELESGELSLEESLARFEEGIRLSRASQTELDQAEARIEELLGLDKDGSPILSELAP